MFTSKAEKQQQQQAAREKAALDALAAWATEAEAVFALLRDPARRLRELRDRMPAVPANSEAWAILTGLWQQVAGTKLGPSAESAEVAGNLLARAMYSAGESSIDVTASAVLRGAITAGDRILRARADSLAWGQGVWAREPLREAIIALAGHKNVEFLDVVQVPADHPARVAVPADDCYQIGSLDRPRPLLVLGTPRSLWWHQDEVVERTRQWREEQLAEQRRKEAALEQERHQEAARERERQRLAGATQGELDALRQRVEQLERERAHRAQEGPEGASAG